MKSIEEILGLQKPESKPLKTEKTSKIDFSFLFFSDVRKDIMASEKYQFMRDITLFADQSDFTAIYIPERHFTQFGAIYPNSAIMASYLIPQTKRIRFRTAGISLPLHHPAEVVEWWAMNDVLSGGRVDLGFGTGWNKADFILEPDHYQNRKQLCLDTIPIVKKLWRGESVSFAGADAEMYPITVYPRPVQPELNIWLLGTSDDTYRAAGTHGYNVFTMLAGASLTTVAEKVAIYRQARKEAGYNPETGTFSLMLHTYIHPDKNKVKAAVEAPLKHYIKNSLGAHLAAGLGSEIKAIGEKTLDDKQKEKIVDYSFQRYFDTAALFGSVEDCHINVALALGAGVNEIACLVDFGIDYEMVKESLPYLRELVSTYQHDAHSVVES